MFALIVLCSGLLRSAQPAAIRADDPLVSALRQRLETAKLVAEAKHNSGAPVEDRVRERAVIDSAVRQAVKLGVDPEAAVKVFTAQIEANKVAQRAFLNQWKTVGPFTHAPNLATEVRPMLDKLTTQILLGLRAGRYRSGQALHAGPSGRIYGDAWRIAIRPLRPDTN